MKFSSCEKNGRSTLRPTLHLSLLSECIGYSGTLRFSLPIEANSCFFAPVPVSIIAVLWASSSHFVNLNFCASSSTLGIRCSILHDERARHYFHLPSYLAPFHEVNQDTMRSLCAICHSMPPSCMPQFHFPSKNTPFSYFIPVNDICSLDDHAYSLPGLSSKTIRLGLFKNTKRKRSEDGAVLYCNC